MLRAKGSQSSKTKYMKQTAAQRIKGELKVQHGKPEDRTRGNQCMDSSAVNEGP